MRLQLNHLNPEQHTYIVNGCGPKFLGKTVGNVIRFLLPDDFDIACEIHDVDYWVGHTEKDRERSDWIFYETMWAISRLQSWWKRPYYYATAWSAYQAVRLTGEDAFYYGERERTLEDLVAIMEAENDQETIL